MKCGLWVSYQSCLLVAIEMLKLFAQYQADTVRTVLFSGVAGGKVSRDAGPVKGGSTHIAFVDDPTGYKWELIQRSGPIPEPIAQARCLAWSIRPAHLMGSKVVPTAFRKCWSVSQAHQGDCWAVPMWPGSNTGNMSMHDAWHAIA